MLHKPILTPSKVSIWPRSHSVPVQTLWLTDAGCARLQIIQSPSSAGAWESAVCFRLPFAKQFLKDGKDMKESFVMTVHGPEEPIFQVQEPHAYGFTLFSDFSRNDVRFLVRE